LLIVIGAVVAALSLSLAGQVWLQGADAGIVRALGAIAILFAFEAAALRGFGWARWCLVAWLGYLTLRLALVTLLAMSIWPVLGIVGVPLTAGAGYGAYVLFSSADIKAFLAAQRSRSPRIV
jgi:hypothetical protein